MARPLRIEGEDCVYHLSARGDRRQAIFRDEDDRRRFRDRMLESLERFNVELHAWVLMPNHFHFLARTREANLSRWMQWFLGCVTMDFNRRHRLCGHLFQGRFKSLFVEGRGYFAELGRYIHLNPVRGVVLSKGELAERRARLRSYRWSSYRAYAGLEKAPSWLGTAEGYGELGLERAKDRQVRYRQFVELGLLAKIDDPREAAIGQALLGSERFVQRMKDRLRAMKESGALERVSRRGLMREGGEEILQRIARRENRTVVEFCQQRRYADGAIAEAMACLQTEAGWSLRQIAETFGGLKANAVAQRIHQWKQKIKSK